MNISGIKIKGFGNRGSVLIAVMVVTTILSLFLITLQPIMYNYAKGSVTERNLKQAEFSARGANDAIVEAILDGNPTLIAGINNLITDNSILAIDNFTFSSAQMGSIEAKIKRISAEEFNVITKATVKGAERTIGRVIIKEGTTGGSSHSPLPVFDFNNIINSNDNIHTSGAPVVIRNTLNGGTGTNIRIDGDLYLLSNFNKSVGQAQMVITGDFYTGDQRFDVGGNSTLIYKQITYSKVIINTLQIPATSLTTFNTIPTWVKYTGTNYTPGATLNGGSYYVINGSDTIANITSQLSTSVTPSNPVYIIVKSGNTLTLSSAIDPLAGGVPKDPRVVFILEGTATLNVQHLSSIVVFGGISTRLNVNNSSGGNPTLYGQIRVGSISYSSGSFVTLNYRASTTYNPNPGTVTWTAGQYIKTTY